MENNIRVRIGVVLVKDGKILLIKQRKDDKEYWLVPGGGIDYGEKIKDCAKREIKEETNLDIELKQFLFTYESINTDKGKHVLNFFFLAEILSGELKLGKEENLVDLKFFEFEKLKEIKLYPDIVDYLMKVKNNNFKPLDRIPESVWID